MARTFRHPGHVLDIIAPGGGCVGGVPFMLGGLLVVPVKTADAGASLAAETIGVHELPKTAGQVWAAGNPLYFNAGTGALTNVAAAGLPRVGVASEGAGNAATVGPIRLDGASSSAVLKTATVTNGGVPNAAAYLLLDGAGKAAGRVLEEDGAQIDGAVSATNGGAPNANKLAELDAAGKFAGRVLEDDGAKLDGFKAIAQVVVAQGATVGTLANPAGWADGDKVFASIATMGANSESVAEAKVAGGNVTITLTGDPGVGGATINVLRTGL